MPRRNAPASGPVGQPGSDRSPPNKRGASRCVAAGGAPALAPSYDDMYIGPMSRHALSPFRMTVWPPALPVPEVVAVPRLVGWALHGTGVAIDAIRSTEDFSVRHLADHTIAIEQDARSALIWTGPHEEGDRDPEMLDVGDRFETWDLVLAAEHYAKHLGECAIYGSNLIDTATVPDEFFLRSFLALNPDDDPALMNWIRTWGPLQPPEGLWHETERTAPAILRNDDDIAAGRVPYRGLVDPRCTLYDSRSHLVGLLESLVDDVEDGAWKPTYCQFDDSQCGDFGVIIDASPMRLQRALVRLYQAAFDTWLIVQQATVTQNEWQEPTWADYETPEAWRAAWPAPGEAILSAWTNRGLNEPESITRCVELATHVVNGAAVAWSPRVELALPAISPDRADPVGKVFPRIHTVMAIQVLRFIADGLPAQRCANARCGQWFVRQQGRSEYEQYRTSGVLYCSKGCARAQAARTYRRRRRSAAGVPAAGSAN